MNTIKPNEPLPDPAWKSGWPDPVDEADDEGQDEEQDDFDNYDDYGYIVDNWTPNYP